MEQYTDQQLLFLAVLRHLITKKGFTYVYEIEQQTRMHERNIQRRLRECMAAGLLQVETVQTTQGGRKRHQYSWTRKGENELARLSQQLPQVRFTA